MHDFTGFTAEPIKETVKEALDMAEKAGVKGPGESLGLTDTTPEGLTEDHLEMSASEPRPVNEKEDIEEAMSRNKLASHSLAEGSDYSRQFVTSFTAWTLLRYEH